MVPFKARPKFLAIHHSLTVDGRTLSLDDMRRFHIQTRGWEDLAYHCVVEQIEDDVMALLGRDLRYVGAHVKGRNHEALGLVLVGNFDTGPPPIPAWQKAVSVVRMLCELYGIPVEQVQGHRELCPGYTCPGANFNLDAFRHAVAGPDE